MSFLSRYVWLIILLALVFGFAWPTPGLYFQPYLSYILMILMFFSCLKIDLRGMKKMTKSWWLYLVVVVLVFFIPALIFLPFKGLFQETVYVGLIIAAASPSAVSSVFLSGLLGGDSSKALLIVALVHLLSPILIPLVVWVVAHQLVAVSFSAMVTLIAKLVIFPLFLAQIIRYIRLDKVFNKASFLANLLLLIIIIWGTIAPVRDFVFANLGQSLILLLVVFLAVVIGSILSILIGRTKKEDITLVIVDSYKNFTLSSVIALSMFGPAAVLGSVVYNVVDNIGLAILSTWNHKKKRR